MSSADHPKAKADMFAMAVEFEREQEIQHLIRMCGGDKEAAQGLLKLKDKIRKKAIFHPLKIDEE